MYSHRVDVVAMLYILPTWMYPKHGQKEQSTVSVFGIVAVFTPCPRPLCASYSIMSSVVDMKRVIFHMEHGTVGTVSARGVW